VGVANAVKKPCSEDQLRLDRTPMKLFLLFNLRHHVFTTNRTTEELQDTPLLERRRGQASRRWPGVQRHVLYLGRDQFVPGGDLAQGGRGVRRGNGRLPDAGLVSRGSLRGRGGPFLGGAAASADLRLHRPRQWGACWLTGQLWRDLQLDRFWAERCCSTI
jgi:hypothetical protein